MLGISGRGDENGKDLPDLLVIWKDYIIWAKDEVCLIVRHFMHNRTIYTLSYSFSRMRENLFTVKVVIEFLNSIFISFKDLSLTRSMTVNYFKANFGGLRCVIYTDSFIFITAFF